MCQSLAVNESQWERLYRLVEARRSHLGLARNGLQERGGPSSETVRGLKDRQGVPSPRMRRSMDDLDRALEWSRGTSWSLITDDRSDWSRESLASEEHELVRGQGEPTDEADMANFTTTVRTKLRAMPADQREAAMTQILRLLGIS